MKRLVALALLVAACGGASTSTSPSPLALASVSATAEASTSPSPPPSLDPFELSGGPNLSSVGFSRDGSECDGGAPEETFDVGVAIHAVLTMEPALPTGGTVTVVMEKDGTELIDRGQTITAAEPAPCIWGTLRGLEAGRYRVTYTIDPSQTPPVSGEFDVTPVAPAGSASGSHAALAAHAIESLDVLAALAAEDDDLLTANWVIDESEWITDNTAALLAQGGTLARFFDEHTALLEVVGAGGDQAEGIARLLGLRDEIAIEFALPTLPPSPN